MPSYLIANLEIRDAALFARYRDAVEPVIAAYGGRYLVRGGELEVLAGQPGWNRLVVLEFPSLADAKRFYDSDEYRPVMQLRLDSCVSDLALMEGYAGAPPAARSRSEA